MNKEREGRRDGEERKGRRRGQVKRERRERRRVIRER